MKTTSSVVNSRSLGFGRYTWFVVMSVVASALAGIHPAFAQTSGEFDPETSIEHHGVPLVSDPGDPWNITPPALADPALTPAPTAPVEPPLSQMRGGFLPGEGRGLIESWDDPAIPATSPMLVSAPASTVRPGGGLYSPLR